MICSYGCGKPALFVFKNGKCCCSSNVSKCEKILEKNRGHIVTNETRLKVSNTKKGNTKVWNKGKFNIYSAETIKKMSDRKKGIVPWNKGVKNPYSEETIRIMSSKKKGKKLTQEHINKVIESQKINGHPRLGKLHSFESRFKMSLSSRLTIDYIKEKYPTFYIEEELRYNPDKSLEEREIQVHCKNHSCPNSKEKGGWFTPLKKSLYQRIYNLEKDRGNDGSYFYCSNECKTSCLLYNLNTSYYIDKRNEYSKYNYTNFVNYEDYQVFRKFVLTRDNYICQFCGKEATDVHHERPQKLEPFFSLDPDYAWSCCEKCHYEKGHKKGTECNTWILSKKHCNNGDDLHE
jgi:hypothetical protein